MNFRSVLIVVLLISLSVFRNAVKENKNREIRFAFKKLKEAILVIEEKEGQCHTVLYNALTLAETSSRKLFDRFVHGFPEEKITETEASDLLTANRKTGRQIFVVPDIFLMKKRAF